MIEAVMPSGVEHATDGQFLWVADSMIEAVMPSGVEHTIGMSLPSVSTSSDDRSRDAVRR